MAEALSSFSLSYKKAIGLLAGYVFNYTIVFYLHIVGNHIFLSLPQNLNSFIGLGFLSLELKPILIFHSEGNPNIPGSDLILVGIFLPLLVFRQNHLHLQGLKNPPYSGGTSFLADTRAQTLTSHTFSYNISSAYRIHLFAITCCLHYHCTGPYIMAASHEKTH